MSIVYLNGEYLPLEDAWISPLDRGFTFGDGVYEVIPVYHRRIFLLNEHLRRLDNSLSRIYLVNPLSFEDWSRILRRVVESNEGEDQSIYLQVTRGVSWRDHNISDDNQATVFAMSRPLTPPVYNEGVGAVTHRDIRWEWCDIKAITLLPSVMLRHEARLVGAREAILIRDGSVTEGAASNVFVCRDGNIRTPLKDGRILPGITRDLLVELLAGAGLRCIECVVSESELHDADEIWLTSSTQEIMPVVRLNGKPIADGVPGRLWRTATALYQKYKQDFCEGKQILSA